MKPTKTLMCAMAVGAMIFAAGKVSAVVVADNLGVINISGTVLKETDSHPSTNMYLGKVTKKSFKTKDILSLLADATGNGWFTDKGSELVYNPNAYNPEASTNGYGHTVYGIFYVTNTITHAAVRLDGLDEFNNYYSYIEFDSWDAARGFWDNPSLGENSVNSYVENTKTGKSSDKITGHGLLYIHDDPYEFDITDFPSEVFLNDNVLIIRGLGIYQQTFNFNTITGTQKFNLSGSGDGLLNGTNNVVVQGKITFKSKGIPPLI